MNKKISGFIFISLVFLLAIHSCRKLERVARVKTDNIIVDSTVITANGTIIETGKNGITDHGFCWSIGANPTIDDNVKSLGIPQSSGVYDFFFRGEFECSFITTTEANTYHIRAYISDGEEIKYGNDKTFTINYFISANDTILLPNDSGIVIINVKSNAQWTAESDKSWLSLTNSSGNNDGFIEAKYTFNYSPVSRIAHIMITENTGVRKRIQIIQDGISLYVNPSSLSVSYIASSVTFIIISNISWVCSSDQTWCTVNPTNGNNNYMITLTYSTNTITTNRTAIITVSGNGANPVSVTLVQGNYPVLPTVITSTLSNVSYNSAMGGGNVTSTGGDDNTTRGVCWNTAPYPTISNSHTSNGTGAGAFTTSILGLTSSTTYYVRAYATNIAGTAYGANQSFTTLYLCGSSLVTDIEGNSYNTVLIGTQCWMKENLMVTKYKNGTDIIGEYDGFYSNTEGAYYAYVSSSYISIYGHIYNWYAVNNVNGLCPTGWHVPSNTEWTTLVDYLGGFDVAGGKLKETGTTHWNAPNTGATNSSGYTGLPGSGMMGSGTYYDWIGEYGHWWSSTPDGGDAYSTQLSYDSDNANCGSFGWNYPKSYGLNIRCLKD